MHRKASGAKPPEHRPAIVLVGAGTSHLALLFGKVMGRWLEGASVTLVSPRATVLYSGSLPAHVAGERTRDSITVDLVSLCARAAVTLVLGTAERIDPQGQTVVVRGRATPVRYDYLALATGAGSPPGILGDALSVRPFEVLLDGIERWKREGRRRIAVVGAGASGAELAVALAVQGFTVTLHERADRVLPEQRPAFGKKFERRLAAAGVVVRKRVAAHTFSDGKLRFDDGETQAFDGVLWATGAAPSRDIELHRNVLPLDAQGFVRVGRDLRVVGFDNLFATGDMATVEPRSYAKNGVVAVHQGRFLGRALERAIRKEPGENFTLERPTLWILNGGRGHAVAGFGALAWEGRGARRLKERLDAQWLAQAAVPKPEATSMLCDGCGGKASARALVEGLAPDFEDVGLWPASGGWTAGTVDALSSWTDDAYVFGEIATLHALSDVYAKGLEPKAVLVAATIPRATTADAARILAALDGGVRAGLRGTDAKIVSGHTGYGDKLSLAVSVTAEVASPEALWRKDRLQSGDALVLTKPLGTGMAMAALAQGACPAELWSACEASMRTSNRAAAEAARVYGVRAATDVTGFGLAVAALEMARLSGKEIEFQDLWPAFPGVETLYQSALRPSLWEENRHRARTLGDEGRLPAIAYDPQTSGGLLLAVSAMRADALAQAIGGFVVARLR